MCPDTHIAVVGASTPSHIYPSLVVIRELTRRGHRVTYAIGSDFASLVAPTGAGVVAHPSILPAAAGDAWPEDPIAGMQLFLDEGIAVLPRLLDAFGGDHPDLVLHDIGGHAGPVLAARFGVPAVQLSPTYVAWDTYEQDLADVVAAIKSAPGADRFYRQFGAWLAENGVKRTPDEVMGRPEHGVVLIPRVLQPMADRVSDRFVFAGPCLDPDRLAEDWPASGDPLLYVSFGTSFTDQLPVYRSVVEAFGGSPWHVVLVIGDRVDPRLLGDLPANVELHPRVPQLAVLRRASVFVTHTGMGSAMESLWFGVPTVTVPIGYDQPGNADRLAELGVSVRLGDAASDPVALRAAVEAVAVDPGIRARMAAISAELRSTGGTAAAADAVESLLPGGSRR